MCWYGAIKHPDAGYKLDSFIKTSVPEQEKYDCELGWIYVNEKMRGLQLGNKLMESICNYMSSKFIRQEMLCNSSSK